MGVGVGDGFVVFVVFRATIAQIQLLAPFSVQVAE